MKHPTRNTDDALLKRAKTYDGMAERAEIRRARAAKLGNKREEEGAKITIQEAHASARRLRAQVGQ